MKDYTLFIGAKEDKYYACALIDTNRAERIADDKEAIDKAIENADRVNVKMVYSDNKEKTGSLTADGIFEVEFDCGNPVNDKINLKEMEIVKDGEIEESKKNDNSKKYLVVLNLDSDIGILFKKNFTKENALHLKKVKKGKRTSFEESEERKS